MKKQACGVYLLKNNKILFLVRRKENDQVHLQNVYLPIGGKVELGEDIETCAIREVKEEAAVTVHSLNLKGIVLIRGQNTGEFDWINFIFTSSDFTGEPTAGNEGSFEWIDKTEIDKHNLYQGDKISLKYMFQYNFFVADLLYKNFKLINYKLIKAI